MLESDTMLVARDGEAPAVMTEAPAMEPEAEPDGSGGQEVSGQAGLGVRASGSKSLGVAGVALACRCF